MVDHLRQQQTVARIALSACGVFGFALAGSGAIREHGLTERPTADLDLFTVQSASQHFGEAVQATVAALRASGYEMAVLRSADGFAQLTVAADDWSIEIDMAVDWRAEEPAILEVGPVLAMTDAVANKVVALYSRGEARDYLDVDAIRLSGRYSEAELLELAVRSDPGFDSEMFAHRLTRVSDLTEDQVCEYGVDADQLRDVQARCREWANSIVRDGVTRDG